MFLVKTPENQSEILRRSHFYHGVCLVRLETHRNFLEFEFETQLNRNLDRNKQFPDPTPLDSGYNSLNLNPSCDEFLANATLSIFNLGCRIRRIRRVERFFVLKQTTTSTIHPETTPNDRINISGETLFKKIMRFQDIGVDII